ncbi:hypothetical protein ACP275_04G120800 [Erythranthe tilingii]
MRRYCTSLRNQASIKNLHVYFFNFIPSIRRNKNLYVFQLHVVYLVQERECTNIFVLVAQISKPLLDEINLIFVIEFELGSSDTVLSCKHSTHTHTNIECVNLNIFTCMIHSVSFRTNL